MADRLFTPSAQETLRRLEERLEHASDVAERLMAQAATQASARMREATEEPPPRGWQESEHGGSTRVGGELEQLLQVFSSVGELIPPDLQRRLAEALRQLMLAVRALLDWCLERLEHRHENPVEVQDIPIL
jgi:hypothetical protein